MTVRTRRSWNPPWEDAGVAGPSGTLTFLFTDIEGSTRLWQTAPADMPDALARHDSILRAAIEGHGGYVFSTGGDGFAAAFPRAAEGIAAAVEAQAALAGADWPETAPIRVRMALNTGEAEERDGDYFGTAVNRAARLMAAGHGGQVLVSAVTAGVVDVAGLVDLGEHLLKDLSTPQRVFQVGDGRFPPLRSVDAVPGNLPTMLTELIGRTDDIADLVTLLDMERLVTLTGPGGVGKTSLALAVAAMSTGSFPDGCWFAELAPVSTWDQVVRAVAAAMGASATDLPGLARFLSDRRALIVVDNCERVLSDAASLLETVLAAGPEVVIIATSQAPLGVRGEVVWEVPSLAFPGPDTSAAEAVAASAVGLFVARASAASRRFVLDETNVEAVVDICRRLDGLPLAIELAAARVRGMGPAEIARRLDERFRLLSAGGGVVDRHRTLFAALSWSHDLLSDEEKVVFRRLAAFPASFDLAAAEAIAGGGERLDAVDALLRLVDRSLVVYDPTSDRYRLLETMRQYGADRLIDAGETDMVRDRHTEFFLGLAAKSVSMGGAQGVATRQRLEAEMDNLRAVAEGLGHRQRWGDLLRLCHQLLDFLWSRAPVDGYRWCRDAIEHLPDLDLQERANTLGELDWLRMHSGRSDSDGLEGAGIALAEANKLSPSPYAWLVRTTLQLRLMPGRGSFAAAPVDAKLIAEQTLAIAEDHGDDLAAVLALGLLACVLANIGELDRSERLAAETVRRARLVSHSDAIAMAVCAAAGSYLTNRAQPDFDGALRTLERDLLDPGAIAPGLRMTYQRLWGSAHLGLGHSKLAVLHLTRSVRLADQFAPAFRVDTALALSVALGEAGQTALSAQLDGYARAHFQLTIRDLSHAWLEARLAAVEGAAGIGTWTAARDAGARLGHTGFVRLLACERQRYSLARRCRNSPPGSWDECSSRWRLRWVGVCRSGVR